MTHRFCAANSNTAIAGSISNTKELISCWDFIVCLALLFFYFLAEFSEFFGFSEYGEYCEYCKFCELSQLSAKYSDWTEIVVNMSMSISWTRVVMVEQQNHKFSINFTMNWMIYIYIHEIFMCNVWAQRKGVNWGFLRNIKSMGRSEKA